MTDLLPQLAPHDARQRQRNIHDKLRALGRHVPLLCDSMYERGEFSEQAWVDLHVFRHDQAELHAARVKGQIRGARPKDAKPDKLFRMGNIGIERALGCQRLMTGACYDTAMILVGLKDGEVELIEAIRAAWEVGKVYRGEAGKERWRDWG